MAPALLPRVPRWTSEIQAARTRRDCEASRLLRSGENLDSGPTPADSDKKPAAMVSRRAFADLMVLYLVERNKC